MIARKHVIRCVPPARGPAECISLLLRAGLPPPPEAAGLGPPSRPSGAPRAARFYANCGPRGARQCPPICRLPKGAEPGAFRTVFPLGTLATRGGPLRLLGPGTLAARVPARARFVGAKLRIRRAHTALVSASTLRPFRRGIAGARGRKSAISRETHWRGVCGMNLAGKVGTSGSLGSFEGI